MERRLLSFCTPAPCVCGLQQQPLIIYQHSIGMMAQ
jgi:hypothetical protein